MGKCPQDHLLGFTPSPQLTGRRRSQIRSTPPLSLPQTDSRTHSGLLLSSSSVRELRFELFGSAPARKLTGGRSPEPVGPIRQQCQVQARKYGRHFARVNRVPRGDGTLHGLGANFVLFFGECPSIRAIPQGWRCRIDRPGTARTCRPYLFPLLSIGAIVWAPVRSGQSSPTR